MRSHRFQLKMNTCRYILKRKVGPRSRQPTVERFFVRQKYVRSFVMWRFYYVRRILWKDSKINIDLLLINLRRSLQKKYIVSVSVVETYYTYYRCKFFHLKFKDDTFIKAVVLLWLLEASFILTSIFHHLTLSIWLWFISHINKYLCLECRRSNNMLHKRKRK